LTSFISKGKGKNRKVIPITKSGMSKRSFNSTPTKMKGNFRVPTLPNDPPRSKIKEPFEVGKAKNIPPSELIGMQRQTKTLPNDPPKSKNTSLSNKLQETGDPSADERTFEVKDLEASPEIDDVDPPKIVHSDIIVRVTNFFEATGDDRFEDEPYVGELLLVPQNRSLSKDTLESIADSAGIDEDEVTESDKLGYGASIRLGDELTGDDPIEIANELGKQAPAQAGLIGFMLDRPVNRIGDTGWDELRKFAL
jgi:hypothetical protein